MKLKNVRRRRIYRKELATADNTRRYFYFRDNVRRMCLTPFSFEPFGRTTGNRL